MRVQVKTKSNLANQIQYLAEDSWQCTRYLTNGVCVEKKKKVTNTKNQYEVSTHRQGILLETGKWLVVVLNN